MWTVDWVFVSDSVTPPTVAHQAPLSMGFSGQESWSGLPFPSPRDLPDPGIEPMPPVSLASQGDSFPRWATGETSSSIYQGGSEGCFSALNVHVKHLGILEKSRSRLWVWGRACPNSLTFPITPCGSPALPYSQLLELFSVYRFHYKVSPWRSSALFNVSAGHCYY